jgi:hypothetical protein
VTTFWAARIHTDGVPAEEAFDDAVGEWHDSDSDLPLHEYLGLTWDEYAAVVSSPRLTESVADLALARHREVRP